MYLKKNTLKNLVVAALVYAGSTQAQSWNVGGNATGAVGKIGTTTNFNLQVITNNSAKMTVTTAGKIGIGTTTPAAVLQIQKATLTDVLIKSTGAGAQLSIDRPANGYESIIRFTETGVPQWKAGLLVNGTGIQDFVIINVTTGTDALTISRSTNSVTINSGNLLVGNSNPSMISLGGNDLSILPYAPNSGTPGNLILTTTTFGNFKAGNVGIGTATPDLAKLMVQGYVGQSVAIFKRSASSAGISIAADWPEIYFNAYYNGGVKAMKAGKGALIGCEPGAGTIYFRNTSTPAATDNDPLTLIDRMMIVGDGRVLINNNNYTSTFGVKKIATTDDCATFGGTQHFSHFMFGVNENTYIRGGKDNSAVVLADAGTQMVGVGTSTPAYKLDVCGTMRAKEVRVATGWCDYVFADDYELKPLCEVEAFIKENKHLPDVTPGAVIESEGLEVGKTSAQMIKKIEELTLYVIDLQKQVDKLKKNNK
jgi:hypothetical protein